MSSLIIEHTEAEGTLLSGTARGDGSAEVVKSLGWRWGRSIGQWFVPRSRDAVPRRELIEQTAGALREAGFEVVVSIDSTPGDRGEAEERRLARAEQRSRRLSARAEREQALSDAREAASRQITDHIPLGQPLLTDHHSYAGDLRRRQRATAHFEASVEHQQRANQAAAAAETAGRALRYRHNPVTVANRIERLEVEIRKDERFLAGVSAQGGTLPVAVLERVEATKADLEYWQEIRAEQLADGTATNYGRDTVKAGDLVKIGNRWEKVVRANLKTVTIETGYSWTTTAPWHTVQDHQPAAAATQHKVG